jgi:hypothetical protein
MLARSHLVRVLAILSVALVASTARATVVVEIPIEQLIAGADAIVHAHVLRTGTQLETLDGHLEPHTLSELRVLDVLAGAVDERVTIDEIGGVDESGGSAIDGTPRYVAGDEVIVFLHRLPSGAYRTLGMAQGRFDVTHAIAVEHGRPIDRPLVSRDTTTIAFASWVDGVMQVRDGHRSPSVDYDVFVAFVAGVIDQLALPSEPRTSGAL